MTPLRTAILCALLCLSLPAGGWRAEAAPSPSIIVAVVHSYNPEYVWTQDINQGIRSALKGLPVAFDYFYMDAKRQPGRDHQAQAARRILDSLLELKPKIVIAADDAAQEFLVEPYLKGRPDTQVIFCGVNAPLAKYGFPAANVSGVIERWHYREGFALLTQVAPKVRTAAFLVDDSESGHYVANDLRQELQAGAKQGKAGAYPLRVVGVETLHTLQQWQERVRYYQHRADALALGLYHSLVDADTGRVVPPEQVMAWTQKFSPKPTLGFSDATREHGILCGVLESGQEQGYLAGTMAREVLTRGVAAGSLPVRANKRGLVLLNLKTAQRLGIAVPFALIESAGEVIR